MSSAAAKEPVLQDDPMPAAEVVAAPTRLVFWGTYDVSKPRTRILRDGLCEIGVEVIEIHADIWGGSDDKSQIGKLAMIRALARMVFSYPVLIWRYLRAPAHDAVIIPYLGQFDVLILWPFARLRRKPIIWDMFLSLFDTVVNDRKMAGPGSLVARILKAVEWLGCRAADRVLLDTKPHAAHISRLFKLRDGKADAVPVGAEPAAFSRQPAPAPHEGPTRVLFYGQLIPLHGVQTILDAALSARGRRYQWRIIGTGQDRALLERALGGVDVSHIDWQAWVPYETLTQEIIWADICLGIFGASEKAASVVPNKVYQSLITGRSVITRRSPAMEDAFKTPEPGLELVSHSDPEALLDAIEALEAAGFPVMPAEQLELAHPKDIARALCDIVNPVIEGRQTRA